MHKKILFVLTQPPHNGCMLQETLDIVLTTAAFDQSVSLLFVDDGVMQIKTGQTPENVDKKDTLAIFKALEIYDIHDLFVEVESLQDRGLKPGGLCLPVKEYYRKEIAGLIKKYDLVFGA